jgi:predicted GIY-YIG superfamily endonuclease
MARQNVIGTIYLLHFSRPFKHAKHYLGWAENLDARLAEHEKGRGANLLAVIQAEGITWTVARTWEGDRYRERQLKQRGKSRCCPICKAQEEVSTVVSKDWRARAACRDVDPELFFPLGDLFPPKQEAAAKAVCRRCPVRAECLSWACRTGLTFGIAGGKTEPERRALRKLAS